VTAPVVTSLTLRIADSLTVRSVQNQLSFRKQMMLLVKRYRYFAAASEKDCLVE